MIFSRNHYVGKRALQKWMCMGIVRCVAHRRRFGFHRGHGSTWSAAEGVVICVSLSLLRIAEFSYVKDFWVPNARDTLQHRATRPNHLEALPKRSRSIKTPPKTPQYQCFRSPCAHRWLYTPAACACQLFAACTALVFLCVAGIVYFVTALSSRSIREFMQYPVG